MKEVQPWVLMWFSGNVYADELSGYANPLLPVQSWYSPWNTDSTLLCTDAVRAEQSEGEEYETRPCSSHSRLNGSHQPITAWIHQFYSSPYPAPTQLHQISKQGSRGWMKWEWDDNEQWMSHASRVGCSLKNLRQQWAVRERSYFQNHVATETDYDWTTTSKSTKVCMQNMTSLISKLTLHSDALGFIQKKKIWYIFFNFQQTFLGFINLKRRRRIKSLARCILCWISSSVFLFQTTWNTLNCHYVWKMLEIQLNWHHNNHLIKTVNM